MRRNDNAICTIAKEHDLKYDQVRYIKRKLGINTWHMTDDDKNKIELYIKCNKIIKALENGEEVSYEI